MHHSCTCLNGACCWRKIATDHPKNGADFASFNARQLCFQNTFATEEYQAGNCQDFVVFGKEAATGLHEDSEDSDCWWTDSMARWHFRGTTADVMLFTTFCFTPIGKLFGPLSKLASTVTHLVVKLGGSLSHGNLFRAVSNNECTASYNQPTVYHEVWNKLIEIVWNCRLWCQWSNPMGNAKDAKF